MELKRLVLLRHAKSSWDDPQLDDHDRPLNPRGERAAARVGRCLRDQGIAPDLVLCSSSLRTRQTLQLLQLDPTVQAVIERGLYGAAAGELLDRLRYIDDAVTSVLVVAHNPGIQELAITLTDDLEGLASFPTAALADLRIPISAWAELRPGIATVAGFTSPRELD